MNIESQKVKGERGTRLTDEDNQCIIVAKKHFGITYSQVQERFQWETKSTVGEYRNQNNKGGRPSISQKENIEKNILYLIKDDRYLSSQMIAESLKSKNSQDVSKQTICRILRKMACNMEKSI